MTKRTLIIVSGLMLLPVLGSPAWATYHPRLGRFMQRDPLGYVDGMGSYVAYHVLRGGLDPSGMLGDRAPAGIPSRFEDPCGKVHVITDKHPSKGWMDEKVIDPDTDETILEHRRVYKCTVVVALEHYGKKRFCANGVCSAAGSLSCWGDVQNRNPDDDWSNGDNSGLKDGTIDNFPELTAPIGSGTLREDYGHPEVPGYPQLNSDHRNYNGGYGAGLENFRSLARKAWRAAVDQGRQFAEDCKCECKTIFVKFVANGRSAREALGEELGGPSGGIKTKKIPCKQNASND